MKRTSIVKSTKAQRARAEAIASKKDRYEGIIGTTVTSKTPIKGDLNASVILKRASTAFGSSRKTPLSTNHRSSLHSSFKPKFSITLSNHTKGKSIGALQGPKTAIEKSNTQKTTLPKDAPKVKPDLVAIEAKTKANQFLKDKRKSKVVKSLSRMPDFKKIHDKEFRKQKALTSVVEKVK
jgi:hypothetical protein